MINNTRSCHIMFVYHFPHTLFQYYSTKHQLLLFGLCYIHAFQSIPNEHWIQQTKKSEKKKKQQKLWTIFVCVRGWVCFFFFLIYCHYLSIIYEIYMCVYKTLHTQNKIIKLYTTTIGSRHDEQQIYNNCFAIIVCMYLLSAWFYSASVCRLVLLLLFFCSNHCLMWLFFNSAIDVVDSPLVFFFWSTSMLCCFQMTRNAAHCLCFCFSFFLFNLVIVA